MGVFACGTGTANDPYQIDTAQHLLMVSYFPRAHFKLINDIDLDQIPSGLSAESTDGTNWIPIERFQGTFDGNGHAIRNIRLRSLAVRPLNLGFFGSLYNATVTNLTVQGSIDVRLMRRAVRVSVGGIAGDLYSSKVHGCLAQITILTYNQYEVDLGESWSAGMLIGKVRGENCHLQDCRSEGTLWADSFGCAGGLVGRICKSEVAIQACSSRGQIFAERNVYVGGLVGYIDGDSIFRSRVDYSEEDNASSIYQASPPETGQLPNLVQNRYANAVLSSCVNGCNINVVANGCGALGGLVGRSRGHLTVTDSFNRADVICRTLIPQDIPDVYEKIYTILEPIFGANDRENRRLTHRCLHIFGTDPDKLVAWRDDHLDLLKAKSPAAPDNSETTASGFSTDESPLAVICSSMEIGKFKDDFSPIKCLWGEGQFVWSIGGLVGNASYAILSHCHNSGLVQSNGYNLRIGGLLGEITGTCVLDSCHNNGNIDGESSSSDIYAGGLAGCCDCAEFNVMDSHNRGDIKVSSEQNCCWCGGWIGYLRGCADYQRCLSTGSIVCAGKMNICGAFVGISQGRLILLECGTCSRVECSSSKSSCCGLLVGVAEGIKLFIDNCFNVGEIFGHSQALKIGTVAGLVNCNFSLRNYYDTSICHVKIDERSINCAIGNFVGLMGLSGTMTVDHSYRLRDGLNRDLPQVAIGKINGHIKPISMDQMQNHRMVSDGRLLKDCLDSNVWEENKHEDHYLGHGILNGFSLFRWMLKGD